MDGAGAKDKAKPGVFPADEVFDAAAALFDASALAGRTGEFVYELLWGDEHYSLNL
jgi:hypothetical protein